eukprot:TRINITY_DN103089_c0_g1_i1.p1 TRINITY_DN103089_c0_g1~~TRINITY_DN103089_c0_g1_i1.p1  ORF type:complete len:181 (+),score=41.58 TRINITY_DN103089_c0_g1_i1:510-1052(+)
MSEPRRWRRCSMSMRCDLRRQLEQFAHDSKKLQKAMMRVFEETGFEKVDALRAGMPQQKRPELFDISDVRADLADANDEPHGFRRLAPMGAGHGCRSLTSVDGKQAQKGDDASQLQRAGIHVPKTGLVKRSGNQVSESGFVETPSDDEHNAKAHLFDDSFKQQMLREMAKLSIAWRSTDD